MNKHVFDLPIRVLVYAEDGETVAHGLEMDLIGYGASEKEAVDHLKKSIRSQIAFAAFKGNPEMVYFPASEELFERWEKANAARLRGLVGEDKSARLDVNAVVIMLPSGAPKPRKFKQDPDAVCA